jgi:hypothetical protein
MDGSCKTDYRPIVMLTDAAEKMSMGDLSMKINTVLSAPFHFNIPADIALIL